MSEQRDVFIKGKLDEINNELENTFLTAERKEVLLRDREKFEKELAEWEAEQNAKEEQQQAAQLRIQEHEENKEGLSQFVQELDLFETFFPNKKYAEIIGLSEYIEKQQLFNQILHKSFVQVEDQRRERHEQELADRDEKIVALKSALQQNHDDYDRQLKHLEELRVNELEIKQNEIEKSQEIIGSLEEELSAVQARHIEDLKKAEGKHAKLNAEIDDLCQQLEASKKKFTPKFTESMSDLLSQAKIKSAAEIAVENTAPFRGPIKLEPVATASLEVPGFLQTSFDSGMVSESGTGEQFRSENFGCELAEGNDSGRVAEQENMGAASIEERVAALEAHVFGFVKGVAS